VPATIYRLPGLGHADPCDASILGVLAVSEGAWENRTTSGGGCSRLSRFQQDCSRSCCAASNSLLLSVLHVTFLDL
jgi:hypothetical protein